MNLLWKLAFKNLQRNMRRTLATAFTVCFGFTGLILLSGYILYAEKAVRTLTIYVNHVGHVSIYKKDGILQFFARPSEYQIQGSLLSQIQNVLEVHKNEIEKVGLSLSGMGLLSNGVRSIPVIVQGLDPELELFTRLHPDVLEFIPDLGLKKQTLSLNESLLKNPDSISITKGVGELIGKMAPFENLPQAEREVQIAAKSFLGDFNAINATLGPMHSTGLAFIEDVSVVMPLKTLQDLLVTDGVSSLSVYLKKDIAVTEFKKLLDQEFLKQKLPLEVFPFYDENVGMFYAGNMSFLLSMGFFFFILILGAVVLSVVNTITIGIIERTKEIGTLRAIGFNSKVLSELFLRENFMIALFCVVLGTGLGFLVAFGVNHADIRFRPTGVANDIPFKILPELWICGLMAIPMVGLTCLTAYQVALRKTKQPLIQLLTDTGASA